MSAFIRTVQALALIAIAGAGGFLAYRLTARQPTIHEMSGGTASNASGSSAPRTLAAAPEPESAEATVAAPSTPARQIPETVPEITLTDSAGARRKLSEWKGRPLLINFWATWCAPCRREIPLLKTLRRDHAADGVEVIGIAVDFRDAVLKYAREMGIDYPVLIGEQDALDAVGSFGMDTVFPFTVFTDKQSRVVTLKIGELHQDEATFILRQVKDVDAGRLALPVARQQIAAGIRELAAARAREGEPASN